ncbi:hypothetical protein RintRC_4829 [Richelia intracellularis]|nr:hypothetical protein RintRC_4829 [Richelia intracellularis]
METNEFLGKPIDEDQLIAITRKYLHNALKTDVVVQAN